MILLKGTTTGGTLQHMATDIEHARKLIAALEAIATKHIEWTMEETVETEIVAAAFPEHRDTGKVSDVTDSTTGATR